jgi:hypothetical protein
MSFIISDEKRNLSLTRGECLVLELSLNVSSNRFNYKNIGDKLYEYYCSPEKKNNIIVSSTEFDYLLLLKSKNSWKLCYDL